MPFSTEQNIFLMSKFFSEGQSVVLMEGIILYQEEQYLMKFRAHDAGHGTVFNHSASSAI
jgi:hypothetical protein